MYFFVFTCLGLSLALASNTFPQLLVFVFVYHLISELSSVVLLPSLPTHFFSLCFFLPILVYIFLAIYFFLSLFIFLSIHLFFSLYISFSPLYICTSLSLHIFSPYCNFFLPYSILLSLLLNLFRYINFSLPIFFLSEYLLLSLTTSLICGQFYCLPGKTFLLVFISL